MDLNEVRIAQVSVLLERDLDLPDTVSRPRWLLITAGIVMLDLLVLLLILD
jgi:hypothetical protein